MSQGAMRHLIYMAVPLAMMTLCGVAIANADEVRACDFEVKSRCVSGDVSVTLAGGKISRIEVNVIWCGQSGSPGYTCSIDSSRNDPDSQWSEEAGATVIANKSPWTASQPDRIKVTPGRNVSIDFAQAQSLGRCGAGAELPRAIVIPEKKGACRVWLGEP
jgi:hypothetical protein